MLKSVWWKAIWRKILPLFLPPLSSYWYLNWEEGLYGGRPPGKVCNWNCESNYGGSRNQHLLARRVRVQRQAVRYTSNCKIRCRMKKWSSGLWKLLTKRLWICLARIAHSIYYGLEIPSVLVMYHLFRNFFSPICFEFFSFFFSCINWFWADVGKTPVQYILYGCRQLSWQGLSFLTCEKHLVTIKRQLLSLFCLFPFCDFFFFALFIENSFSVLLQRFQCLHALAHLPSGHKHCLCQ